MNDDLTTHPRLDVEIPQIARAASIQEEAGKTYRPRVSNAGSCPRQLAYTARGLQPKARSGRNVVLLDDGSVHEDATCRWLQGSSYEVTERQLGVDVGEVPNAPNGTWYCSFCKRDIPHKILHGHIDGLVHTEQGSFLFEHKAVGEFSFDNLTAEYPLGYITQCCSYLRGLKARGFELQGAILLLKNKNTAEYRQITIRYDFDRDWASATNEWNQMTDIFRDVVKNLIDLHVLVEWSRDPSSNLPLRPYDYDSWQCRFCRFSEECWKDYADEIKLREANNVLSESDELYHWIKELKKARNEKSTNLANEKLARANVVRLMAEKNIRSGIAGNLKFYVSAFSKNSVDESLIPEEILASAKRPFLIQTVKITEMN